MKEIKEIRGCIEKLELLSDMYNEMGSETELAPTRKKVAREEMQKLCYRVHVLLRKAEREI